MAVDNVWFAVRCIFGHSSAPGTAVTTYEERITLWVADSGDEAFLLAEEEALTYAGSMHPRGSYLGLAQCYWLDDEPGDGAELFSLMRQSHLGADDYIRQLFVSVSEGQKNPTRAISSSETGWYAVRCLFLSRWPPEALQMNTYEERITVWHADSLEEAIGRADAEAIEYAEAILESPDLYLRRLQSWRLNGPPTVGAEIFSCLRDSELEPSAYLDTLFDTGLERQRHYRS
jgi:hypothetical protein